MRNWETRGFSLATRDRLLAGGLAASLVALHWPWARNGILIDAPANLVVSHTTAVLGCVVLVWRRRFPRLVYWVLVPACAVWMLARLPGALCLLAVCWVAIYNVCARLERRAALAMGLCTVFVGIAVLGCLFAVNAPHGESTFLAPVVLAAAYLGTALAAAGYRHAHLAYLAEAAQRGAAEERVRIARELHDVLTHTLSGIVVLAGGARRAAARRPADAEGALAEIEHTGRNAMEEVRQLLASLRSDGSSPHDLAALLDRFRRTGLAVTVARPLPESVDHTTYRIVQEALTNCLRHAPGQAARLSVDTTDGVTVEVSNDGPPVAPCRLGHGLTGMRERARLLGGDLSAGPREGGGWAVRASLPVEAR
ncbi:sensor histidine kinase [Streptoalloteichus tenebrarius]|nr:histidine kinase [Streptoalloteichus tenebrarius]